MNEWTSTNPAQWLCSFGCNREVSIPYDGTTALCEECAEALSLIADERAPLTDAS